MFISIIIALVSVYFAYSSIIFLSNTPFDQWGAAHLVICVLSVVLACFAVYSVIRAWKLWKKKTAKLSEQLEAERAKLREKKRAVYMEDFENPAPDDIPESSSPVAEADGESEESDSKM